MTDYQAGYDAARRDAANVAHRHLDLALARRIVGDDAGEGATGAFLMAVAHIRDDILAMPDEPRTEAIIRTARRLASQMGGEFVVNPEWRDAYERRAPVGRNPEGQDPKGLGAEHEHAVPAVEQGGALPSQGPA